MPVDGKCRPGPLSICHRIVRVVILLANASEGQRHHFLHKQTYGLALLYHR